MDWGNVLDSDGIAFGITLGILALTYAWGWVLGRMFLERSQAKAARLAAAKRPLVVRHIGIPSIRDLAYELRRIAHTENGHLYKYVMSTTIFNFLAEEIFREPAGIPLWEGTELYGAEIEVIPTRALLMGAFIDGGGTARFAHADFKDGMPLWSMTVIDPTEEAVSV